MNQLFILAQEAVPSAVDTISHIQGWIQIATNAGFGALVWYLIAKALPDMQRRFDDHSNARMAEYVEQLETTRAAHQAVLDKVAAAHEKQLDRILAFRDRGAV